MNSIGCAERTYSHKLLQLLPLHAGGELALLRCVEAAIASAEFTTNGIATVAKALSRENIPVHDVIEEDELDSTMGRDGG